MPAWGQKLIFGNDDYWQQSFGENRHRVEHVLAVIEHDQDRLASQMSDQGGQRLIAVPIVNPIRWQLTENWAMLLLDV